MIARRYSQAVADLFPETGGWVAGTPMTAQEAAIKLVNGLANWLGSDTKARKLIAEASPEIAQFLPRRRQRGRPATAFLREKNRAVLFYYDLETQRGKSVRAVARQLHKLGMGRSVASVERKLYNLRAERRRSMKENP